MASVAGTEPINEAPNRPRLDDAERWRLDCFLALGFLYDDAITLALANADHWAVERAVKDGCLPSMALRIFA